MSERRMFTKEITDGDVFTSMPPTTQCLYFHLCMTADDDGFSNQVRQALFNAHATTDDFNMLVQKRFIIPFDSGVIVIKHWRMHNLIRSDRYHKTKFLEEKASLILKDNGVYSQINDVGMTNDNQVTTIGIPNGNQMDTEVRLGKDSIGNNIVSSLHSDTMSVKKTDYDAIVAMWNELEGYGDIKPIRKISERGNRHSLVSSRLKEYGIDGFRDAIEKIKQSDFLQGKHNGKPWSITFDWFILPSNFPKVLEGNYDNKNDNRTYSAITKAIDEW